MGSNGSPAKAAKTSRIGNNYNTVGHVGKIEIVQKKNPKDSLKLPERSNVPNKIVAMFKKDGSDVKAIAKYDKDGNKIWEIHTTDHDDLREHYHPWKNGRPVQNWDKAKNKMRNEVHKLTKEMKQYLKQVQNYGK